MATRTKVGANGVNRLPEDKPKENLVETVVISPPNIKTIQLRLVGTTPLMILRFSQKAFHTMVETQQAGSQAKSKKKREPKDFDKNFREAQYIGQDADGTKWCGINAASFRNASISMCKMVGFAMTRAKLSIFVVADGRDILDSTPLIRIQSKNGPVMSVMPVRNATGVIDLRARPRWDEWAVNLTVRFDNDQFSSSDVMNLFYRVGIQGGIGEGRPNSKDGNGMDNGLFAVELYSQPTE